LVTKDSRGRKVVLTEERWSHIQFRHPEATDDPNLLIQVVSSPDELHDDVMGGSHALTRIGSDRFLVVIYKSNGDEGFIVTAYLTNSKRKTRRYGT